MCNLISESTITFDNIRMFWQKVKLYRTTQVMPGPQTRDHRDLLRRTVRDSLPKPDVKVVVEDVGRANVSDDVGSASVVGVSVPLRQLALDGAALDVPEVEALLVRVLLPT